MWWQTERTNEKKILRNAACIIRGKEIFEDIVDNKILTKKKYTTAMQASKKLCYFCCCCCCLRAALCSSLSHFLWVGIKN